ncbi:MAG: dTDP-4-dehydrorhamnose reductase [Eubacterium sp.]|nr:dTDP-4-dehydrorhamnose reductase [Eubacterium sp.]
MKVLITGAGGQLGYDVARELAKRKTEYKALTREDLDLCDKDAIKEVFEAYSPDVLVHCAAYTAVDKAEDDRSVCEKVNVEATRILAELCKKAGCKMVYFSTDYVFGGEGERFYEPYDKKEPLNYYGLTKSYGEDAIISALDEYFIIRISWVFGINGKNFIKTMAKLSETKDEVNVVCDQIGSPTYTVDLAALCCDMIATEKYGIYHVTNEGICSWAELAEAVFEEIGAACKVNKVTTEEYGVTPAKRPKNSRLSKKCLDEAAFKRLPEWRDALKRYLAEMTPGNI